LEWLLPILTLLKRGKRRAGELAEELKVPSTTVKKALYAAKRLGLIDKVEGSYVLTSKGDRYSSQWKLLKVRGRKYLMKGPDGCFLVVARKKGFRALRVPCPSESSGNSS